jgi:hypothetical protein
VSVAKLSEGKHPQIRTNSYDLITPTVKSDVCLLDAFFATALGSYQCLTIRPRLGRSVEKGDAAGFSRERRSFSTMEVPRSVVRFATCRIGALAYRCQVRSSFRIRLISSLIRRRCSGVGPSGVRPQKSASSLTTRERRQRGTAPCSAPDQVS